MRQQTNIDMWLVLHIPKTAGTSLRWALEKSFGTSGVVRDYGPDANATSDIVREHLYSGDESKGPNSLLIDISNHRRMVLIGHFPLQKYADFFEAKNILTFVREPLVRMCSEYLHRIKNKTLTGTFSEFVQKPDFQNSQCRYLHGISAESFVGVTEQYNQSLQYINQNTLWNLSVRKKNVGRRGGGQKFAENLSAHELDLFYTMNAEDVELYQSASQRFSTIETPNPKSTSLIDWMKRNHQR
jgi:hypothetical protein